jgi:hypothetical protein
VKKKKYNLNQRNVRGGVVGEGKGKVGSISPAKRLPEINAR